MPNEETEDKDKQFFINSMYVTVGALAFCTLTFLWKRCTTGSRNTEFRTRANQNLNQAHTQPWPTGPFQRANVPLLTDVENSTCSNQPTAPRHQLMLPQG